MIPVRSSPAPMIITAMIDITALLAKPSNTCAAGTTPVTPSRSMMVIAATSTRTTSNTNRYTVSPRMRSTASMSCVNAIDPLTAAGPFRGDGTLQELFREFGKMKIQWRRRSQCIPSACGP